MSEPREQPRINFFRLALSERIDVLDCSCDDSIASEVAFARKQLSGLRNADVFEILAFADFMVEALIDNGFRVNGRAMTDEMLEHIRPTELLPVVARMLESHGHQPIDNEGKLVASPAMMCCAYLLAEAWHASTGVNSNDYVVEVGKAYGMARLLSDERSALAQLVSARHLALNARKAARVRLDNDPKQAAMKAIRSHWERWQRREVSYQGEADFGRRMHVLYPQLVSDRSIAQAAAKWRRATHPAG